MVEYGIGKGEIGMIPFTEAGGEQLSVGLRRQLLARAGAAAVMLKRADQRELFLRDQMPSRIDFTVDIRNRSLFAEMFQALDCMLAGDNRTLHVSSDARVTAAESVEVIVSEPPIRQALLSYAARLVLLALLISLATALLVFLSLYLVLVRPMSGLTRAMVLFRDNPEDASRIVT